MVPRKGQMNEKDKIVALTHLEDGWLKDKLQDKHVINLRVFQEEIKRLWCLGTPRDLLKKLSDSMPTHLQRVIAASGEMTKY